MAHEPFIAADPAGIAAFWEWWRDHNALFLADGRPDAAVTEELSRVVSGIHPGLSWHISGGMDAGRPPTLVVGSDGMAPARPAAEAWLRSVPADADGWEYASSRRPDAFALSNTFEVAGVSFDPSQTRFTLLKLGDGRFEVTVRHPRFARVPQNLRYAIAFHLLDWAVGEDAVQRWFTRVETPLEMTGDLLSAEDVASRVRAADDARDVDSWLVVSGVEGRRPVVVQVREWLDRFDRPANYLHYTVTVQYRGGDERLPEPDELERFHAEESEFERLNDSVEWVGVRTSNRRRELHFYSDGSADAVAQIESFALRTGRRTESTPDPAWSALAALRTRS